MQPRKCLLLNVLRDTGPGL